MQEASAPLKMTMEITVPIICNVSNDCNVIVRITQDNSEVYLNLCSLTFTNETTARVFKIAVKRDFLYGTNKQTIIKFEVEKLNAPIDFINHHKIPEVVVSREQYIVIPYILLNLY